MSLVFLIPPLLLLLEEKRHLAELHYRAMAHGLPRLSHEEQLKLGISGRVDMVIDTLKEVGLVAGWDCVTKTPALFRVDGMGAVMQGNILATGSGHTFAYSYLNLGQLIHQKDHPNEIKSNRVCRLDDVLEDPSQYKKYSNWSAWSVKEAARMAMKGIRYAAGHAAMASMLQISLVCSWSQVIGLRACMLTYQ